jgi:hypothetical protein
MRSPARILALVSTAALLFGVVLPSYAADAPAAPSVAPSADHPERGMKMEAVEARFGAPASRYPAVGQPPITRWDYPGFVVFFENDLVLHAVVVTGAG